MENLSKDEFKTVFVNRLAELLGEEYNHIWNLSENCENYSAYYTAAYYQGYHEAISNIGRRVGLTLKIHDGEWYFMIGK